MFSRAVLGLALLTSSVVRASPTVHVRAETRIELRTDRQSGEAAIRGVLRDDLGAALPRRNVRVRMTNAAGLSPINQDVITDATGRFEVRAAAAPGVYRVSARFYGDDHHERLLVEREVDLARAEVRLMVRVAGARVDLDIAQHDVTVEASCGVGAVGLSIELLDELDRPLAQGTTDETGQVLFHVASAALAGPGAGRFKARTRGDVQRGDAQTEVPIVRFRQTILTLQAQPQSVGVGEEVRLSGQLTDSQGGLAERAVGLFDANHEHRATVLTNDDGRFEWIYRPPEQESPAVVRAEFTSDGPGRTSSEASPVRIAIQSPPANRWAWSLLPVGLCALVLLLLRRRRHDELPSPAVTRPGIVHEAPRTRRATSHRVAGMILAHRDGAALDGRIVVEGATTQTWMVTAGRFAEELDDGIWTVTFHADGHAPIREQVQVPHHGQWDEIEVRLESWRRRALAPFLRLVERLRPQQAWAHKTIHEIRQPLPESAQELGADVERAFYGPQTPDGPQVENLEKRAGEIGADRHER